MTSLDFWLNVPVLKKNPFMWEKKKCERRVAGARHHLLEV